MGVTERLAKFVVGLDYDDLPADVKELSKHLILDFIGVTLAGSLEPASSIVHKFVKELGDGSDARILGSGLRASVTNAAFANGVMSHVLDYDDAWYWPAGHPSCTVIPLILSLGEKLRLSGKEAIVAHVLGLEAHGKIGVAVQKSAPIETGWHGVGTFGTLGATAAAAKLLKLDVPQTTIAFGICASEAAGLAIQAGTMTKSFHAGNSARNGIVAAMLAKDGYTAHDNIIETYLGFADKFMGPDNYEIDEMAQDLGVTYYMLEPGVLVKRYPSCYSNQWALDTAMELVKEHSIRYEDVDSVKLGAPTEGVVLDNPEPKSGLAAKFSWQFSVALPIVDGEVNIDSFTDDKVNDPRIQDLMRRVKIVPNPERPRDNIFPMTIMLKDGRKLFKQLDFPKGHCNNPFTAEELAEKYKDCARRVLSPEQVDRSIDMVLNLEKLGDITELMDVLTV